MRNCVTLAVLLLGSISLLGISSLCFVGAGEIYKMELQATDPQQKHILSGRALTTFMWAGIFLVLSVLLFVASVHNMCISESVENRKAVNEKNDSSKEHAE